MCQGQVFIEKYPDPVSTQGVWKVLKSIEIPSQTVPVKYFSSLFFSSSTKSILQLFFTTRLTCNIFKGQNNLQSLFKAASNSSCMGTNDSRDDQDSARAWICIAITQDRHLEFAVRAGRLVALCEPSRGILL